MVPIGVSGRHIHLTHDVLEALFGKNYALKVRRYLSQPGEFAAEETVTIVSPSGAAIENVRILGPTRKYTQIELSRSDGLKLGLELRVRETGDLAGSPGLTIVGPKGTVVLNEGAIMANRHIHMSPLDAEGFGLSNKQIVRARIVGQRGLIFENVVVRVSERFVLDFHIDTDDASAAGVVTGDLAEILI
ncbi:MAG: phosphate propanoyltransferase [bacterium]